MKVIHVGYGHPTSDPRIVKKECTDLVKAGYDVTFVTSDKNDKTLPQDENGVKFVKVPLSGIRGVRFAVYLERLYRLLLKMEGDVYHIHEFSLLPLVKMLKRKDKLVIYDMHENAVKQHERGFKKRFGKTLGTKITDGFYDLEKNSIIAADWNITVSPNMVDYMKQYSNNVSLVTNYPILTDDYVEPSYKTGKICFAGGVSSHWNHEYILDAMSLCPQVTYELAGPASPKYLEKLKAKDAWDRVNYHGRIPFEQVPAMQRDCMVGMALHQADQLDKEGTLGNTKLFEYMGVGIPFIATDYTLWADIAKKYDCGICIDPRDRRAIAKAIEYCIENPNRVKEMGQNGRKATIEEYNWQKQSVTLLEVYKEMEKKLEEKNIFCNQ